jgi:hypothetical protein
MTFLASVTVYWLCYTYAVVPLLALSHSKFVAAAHSIYNTAWFALLVKPKTMIAAF